MKFSAVEGNTQKLDGGAMFGNAPKALWSRWLEADELNRIPLAARSLLVEDGDKKYLFDVGIGAFFDPKMRERFGVVEEEHVLLNNLEARGITHEDIDGIVLSHLHFDHAGGLLAPWNGGEMKLLFPNAKVYVGKRHWERAQKPHPREKASFIPELHRLLQESGRLEIIAGDVPEGLPKGLSFREVDGHTIGSLISIFDSEEGPLVFVADLIPGMPWVHLPITMGYDRFPELLIDEKKDLLEWVLEKGGRLFFTHDPEVAFARVEQDEKGRYKGVPERP